MSEKIQYIKVNKLFENRESYRDGDALAYKIRTSHFDQVGIDWEDSKSLNIAFINSYLDGLRNVYKKIINFNLPEDQKIAMQGVIVDKSERHVLKYFEDLNNYEFIDENTLKRI